MVLYKNQDLFKALKELDIIDEKKLIEAFERAKLKKVNFEDVLIKQSLIEEENLIKTISQITSIPYVKLSQVEIPLDVLKIIPEVVAKKQRMISFKKDKASQIFVFGHIAWLIASEEVE